MLEPMDLEEELTLKEFASLLGIGLARINDPAPTIPIEHSAKLAMLGYVVDLAGGLRITTRGRIHIEAGISKPRTIAAHRNTGSPPIAAHGLHRPTGHYRD
jgi:hypothetical protein